MDSSNKWFEDFPDFEKIFPEIEVSSFDDLVLSLLDAELLDMDFPEIEWPGEEEIREMFRQADELCQRELSK